jgi:non-homologous end joining protein Ku
VQIESTRTIEIDQFVPRSEIDDRYIDSPYYIAPDGNPATSIRLNSTTAMRTR